MTLQNREFEQNARANETQKDLCRFLQDDPDLEIKGPTKKY